jgi:hypothetical protein
MGESTNVNTLARYVSNLVHLPSIPLIAWNSKTDYDEVLKATENGGVAVIDAFAVW